jgi:cwf21 domain
MSANVGLSTPRGSGTSGYVQRNLSNLKPRDRDRGAPYSATEFDKHKQRAPNKEILEHERKRKIEVKLFELRDKLEEEGVDEDEIDDQVDELRKKLTKESEREANAGSARGLKSHQVHDIAKAKIEETERIRKAFGIREDYEEGSHWRRQEERKREMDIQRENERIKAEEQEERDRMRQDERVERESSEEVVDRRQQSQSSRSVTPEQPEKRRRDRDSRSRSPDPREKKQYRERSDSKSPDRHQKRQRYSDSEDDDKSD